MQVKVTISVDIPGLDQEIKAAMEAKEISYGELGRQSGVTGSTCWQIAKGESKATKLDTLWKIAKALELDLSDRVKSALIEQTPIWEKKND